MQFINGASYGSPEQMYRIAVDFETPALANYKELFDNYGAANGMLSLVEVITLIIEGNAPDLLEHLDFDEEGYLLDMHADSKVVLEKFASVVCSKFRNIG
ncbi:hypothetical protein [Hymenobacter sp. BRD67]|uniref:hypothetical protein n=1 Tax=Hymenobacter sp. BRD67 TaxID=2675877 RepID=UPI0015646E8C|nr:hypothetical protein [Hymenobacter sp. BRD67]QKG52554.1 hypothetical protein GKZ67_08010 [Hymenobacter sp. BRD67]